MATALNLDQLRLVIDGLADPCFVKDEDGIWRLANAALCDFLQLDAEDIIGKRDVDFLPPDLAAVGQRNDQLTLESGSFHEQAFSITGPSGQLHRMVTRRSAIRDATGRTFLVGTVRDITELTEVQTRLQLAMDASQLGLWSVPPGDTQVCIDPCVATCLGLSPDTQTLEMRSFIACFAPDERLAVRALLRSEERFSGRFALNTGDRHVELHGTRQGGSCLGTLRDVSQSVASAHALSAAADRAHAASRAKSHFLASMSHEIRTPMNAILGYTQLFLRDQTLDLEHRRRAETIHEAGRHLLGLLNDVLDMAKIESGHTMLRPSTVQINSLCRSVLEVFRTQAQSNGVDLMLSVEPTVPQAVLLDEGKLRQILNNLVSNAVQFTYHGQIELHVKLLGPISNAGRAQLQFRVTDSGPGIAADELELLFEPFEQGESGRNRQGGTGLGLAICRRLADVMGGQIRVKSTIGVGSSFFAELPGTVGGPVGAVTVQRVIGLAPDQPNVKVMVVDDRESNRVLFTSMLEAVGIETCVAVDGQDCLDRIDAAAPDLVLMDLRMPKLDGESAVRALRARPAYADLPVIAVSASVFEYGRLQQANAGFNDYLHKPIDVEHLYRLIGSAVGIDFVYGAPPPLEEATTPLDRQTLHAVTTPQSRAALLDAVLGLDYEMFIQRAEALGLPTTTLNALHELAARFAYDELTAALEPEND